MVSLILVVVGALIGTLGGSGVWWAVRYFTDHDQRPARTPVTPGAIVMAPAHSRPLPAWVVCLTLAAWGAFVGWRAPGWPTAIGAGLVTAVLLTISLVDLRVQRVPNLLVLVLLAWAVVQSLWLGRPTLVELVVGLFTGGGVFLLLALFSRGALGAGDVKLAAASGALVGWPAVLVALFLSILAGGIAAGLLLVTRRATRGDTMAYGPYLALGSWLVYSAFLGLWR
mgnify:CR=1 FL=1